MKLNMDNLSYEKLLENRNFVKKARGVLEDSFGENHSLSSDEEVLDDFYSKFREVDTNTLDAYRLYSTSSSELDDMQKKELGEVYEIYRALPSFWEDDSASNVQAFFDYASSIFTDPATYLGVATGGLASVATKAAAQGAVRAGMQTALQVKPYCIINEISMESKSDDRACESSIVRFTPSSVMRCAVKRANPSVIYTGKPIPAIEYMMGAFVAGWTDDLLCITSSGKLEKTCQNGL